MANVQYNITPVSAYTPFSIVWAGASNVLAEDGAAAGISISTWGTGWTTPLYIEFSVSALPISLIGRNQALQVQSVIKSAIGKSPSGGAFEATVGVELYFQSSAFADWKYMNYATFSRSTTSYVNVTSNLDYWWDISLNPESKFRLAIYAVSMSAYNVTAYSLGIDYASLQVFYDQGKEVTNEVKYARTAQSVGGSLYTWSNLANVTGAPDNNGATCYCVSANASHDWLTCLDYGFSVPTGSTILEVKSVARIPIVSASQNMDVEVDEVISGSKIGQIQESWDDVSNSTYTILTTAAFSPNLPTVSQINASNFGVAYRFSLGYSPTVPLTMKADSVAVHLTYLGPLTLSPTSFERGYDGSTAQLNKIIRSQSFKGNYEVPMVALIPFDPNRNYSPWESTSPTLVQNNRPVNAEKGWEGKSVSLLQTSNIRPLSTEFGYDVLSVVAMDKSFDRGWDAKSVSLVQKHFITPNVFESGGWEFGREILFYPSTLWPSSVKNGWVVYDFHIAQNVFMNGGESSKFGWESDKPTKTREFYSGTIPPSRICVTRSEKRVQKVIDESRIIKVKSI